MAVLQLAFVDGFLASNRRVLFPVTKERCHFCLGKSVLCSSWAPSDYRSHLQQDAVQRAPPYRVLSSGRSRPRSTAVMAAIVLPEEFQSVTDHPYFSTSQAFPGYTPPAVSLLFLLGTFFTGVGILLVAAWCSTGSTVPTRLVWSTKIASP